MKVLKKSQPTGKIACGVCRAVLEYEHKDIFYETYPCIIKGRLKEWHKDSYVRCPECKHKIRLGGIAWV